MDKSTEKQKQRTVKINKTINNINIIMLKVKTRQNYCFNCDMVYM